MNQQNHMGFWPFTAWDTSASTGSGPLTTSAQQAALSTQNQQLVAMLDAARNAPAGTPSGVIFQRVAIGAAVVVALGVAAYGVRRLRGVGTARRNPRRRR